MLEWTYKHYLVQLVQLSHYPHPKVFLPYVQSKPIFQFVTVSLCLITKPLVKSLSFVLSYFYQLDSHKIYTFWGFFNATLNSSQKVPSLHIPENKNRDHQGCTQVSTVAWEQ